METNENEILDLRVTYAEKRTELAMERNVLANDRTFLAWIKTGLAGLGGGIAIIHFLTFQDSTHLMVAQWVGVVLVLWAITIFILAIVGYRRTHKNLKPMVGYGGSTLTVTMLVLTLIVLSIFLIAITFREYNIFHLNL